MGICINGSQQILANVCPSVSRCPEADAPWGASWSLSEGQPLAKAGVAVAGWDVVIFTLDLLGRTLSASATRTPP